MTVSAVSIAEREMNYGAKKFYDKKPSDIFKEVAKEEGWSVGLVEESEGIVERDKETGALSNKIFYRSGMKSIDFMRTVIPYAKSSLTGETGYMLYADDSTGTMNFHSRTFKKKSVIYKYEFVIGGGSSVVGSWDPTYSGAAFLSCKGMILEYTDTDGKLMRIIKGDETKSEIREIKAVSEEEAKMLSDYLWDLRLQQVYRASLTLIGVSEVNLFDFINVVALTKNNVPHHSSGVYLVLGVVDSISSGLLNSSLSLLGVNTGVSVSEKGVKGSRVVERGLLK